jgi:hypothetical protein
MHYAIHIKAIGSKRAGTIVAHNIAGNRSVSLHYAISLLENLPLVYMSDLAREEADSVMTQLEKIGVQAVIVPIRNDIVIPSEKEIPAPLPVKQRIVQVPQPAQFHVPVQPISFIYKGNDEDGNKKDREQLKYSIVGAGTVLFIIALLTVMFVLSSKNKKEGAYHPSVLPSESAGMSTRASASVTDSEKHVTRHGEFNDGNSRLSITSDSRIQAITYMDSAKRSNDLSETIAFYKLAIGFNKYNINAWYGLINAYMRAGKNREAGNATDEMKRIFGEDALTLAKIVSPYGDLQDYYLTSNGMYRIEYVSKVSDTLRIVRGVWQIIKAVGPQCNCRSFSVYAHWKNGGALVYIENDAQLSSYEQYRTGAVVTYMER